MDNITVLEVPLNTVWIRDYGPNTVYGNGCDDRIIVDWLYNRPAPTTMCLRKSSPTTWASTCTKRQLNHTI